MPALRRLLQDSKKGFEWPNGIPGYSLDSTSQGPEDDTGVGSAKIWPPVQYLVQQGFKQYHEWLVAQEVAERYFNAVVKAYMNTKMIREALNATKPEFDGHKDFVGWGGLAPIGNFIEYILGFDVDVPQKTIVWHVQRKERHGLQHLKIGDFYVDLLCDARAAADAPCHLTVTSGGAFALQTVVAEKVVHHRIQEGRSLWRRGSTGGLYSDLRYAVCLKRLPNGVFSRSQARSRSGLHNPSARVRRGR